MAADHTRAEIAEKKLRAVAAMAMAKLREIDQIAYIRFASVYQSFDDLEDLKREVDTLFAERETGGGGGGKK